MNFYKNARTSVKLMLAFGLLAAILGLVGYQGLAAANSLNSMLSSLYETHMLGAASIQEAKALIPTIGRQVRQVLLDGEVSAREQGSRELQQEFGALEEAMSTAEKTLVTERGKEAMGKLKRVESEYRPMVQDVARLAVARQDKAAMEELDKAKVLGDGMTETCAALVKMKEALGQQAYDESNALFLSMRRTLIAVVSASVLLAIGLGILIARLISRPLGQTVEVLRAVSERDLTCSICVESTDEVGQMAQALNHAVADMREAMSEVRSSSEGVASAAEQLAASAEELSSGTQEQASSQEETSSSLQELSTAVKQNAENAHQASQLASSARDAAHNGGTVVHAAVSAMAEINAASKRIADIITAIDEIAFQTNLLALNAAVEAARAGEQGRGFAVVASEVRSLAQRSATAAKEIKNLIQDSVRKVEAGSELVNRSGQTLTEIVASVERVTGIVGEIAAASREQAVGIEQVTKAMAQMDQVAQTNSAQTEELSSTSQTLASHAQQMQTLVARFKLESGSSRGSLSGNPSGKRPSKPDGPANRGLSQLSRRVSSPSTAAPVFEEF